jgi:aspartate racemase
MPQTLHPIGLLGGMSWESSVLYYQQLNQYVRANVGGLHSAPLTLDSVDFAQMAQWLSRGDWAEISVALQNRAKVLEASGAQCIALCTNTMHKVFDEISTSVNVPMLHIATPTIAALQAAGLTKVAFLGTRYSMEDGFLDAYFNERGIRLMMPDLAGRDAVHSIIFDELVCGVVTDTSRVIYQRVIADLVEQGAQAVVLGCTEICLLLSNGDVAVPMFDTASLHIQALGAFTVDGIFPSNPIDSNTSNTD